MSSYKDVFHNNTARDSIFFLTTNKDEVINVIKPLKNNKSPGFDSVTSVILLRTFPNHSFTFHVVYLIKFSLPSGEFPDKLKHAVVIPLFLMID